MTAEYLFVKNAEAVIA